MPAVWSFDHPPAPNRNPCLAPSVWEGGYLLSSFRAGCCIESDRIRGVLHLRDPFGHVDVYHVTGQWDPRDGTFQAVHHSGHRALGQMLSHDQVRLEITTRGGRTFTVHAARVPGAAPNPADCSPVLALSPESPETTLRLK
jgi:hypothetical protein